MSKPLKVKIEKHIQKILKSFKGINNEIVFNTEETSVVHPEDNIIGVCRSFKMPVKFALTNLNRLLSALKWTNNEEIEIYDSYILVRSTGDNKQEKSQKIHFHDEKLIRHLDNTDYDSTLVDCNCEFTLTEKDINDIKLASKSLDGGDSPITFNFTENELKIRIGEDQPNLNADICTIKRPIVYSGETFSLRYLFTDFIHLIEGSYNIRCYNTLAEFKLEPLKIRGEEIDLEVIYYLNSGIGN